IFALSVASVLNEILLGSGNPSLLAHHIDFSAVVQNPVSILAASISSNGSRNTLGHIGGVGFGIGSLGVGQRHKVTGISSITITVRLKEYLGVGVLSGLG